MDVLYQHTQEYHIPHSKGTPFDQQSLLVVVVVKRRVEIHTLAESAWFINTRHVSMLMPRAVVGRYVKNLSNGQIAGS